MDPIATEILTAAGGAIAAKIFDGPFIFGSLTSDIRLLKAEFKKKRN